MTMKSILLFLASLLLLPVSLCSQTQNESAPANDDLCIISFNIRNSYTNDHENSWQNRKEAVVKFIKSQKPDAVGMQEACSDQIEYLKKNLTGYTFYGLGRGDKPVEHDEHMTILYNHNRFICIKGGNFWLSETPEKVSKGWDGACKRMVTWVELQERSTKKIFYYFNTHLDHKGPQARLESVKLIVKKIDEIAGKETAVVLGGDMNETIDNPMFAPLLSSMTLARKALNVADETPTWQDYGKNKSGKAIDHLFYRNLKGISIASVTENYGAPYLSDHDPVKLVVKFQ